MVTLAQGSWPYSPEPDAKWYVAVSSRFTIGRPCRSEAQGTRPPAAHPTGRVARRAHPRRHSRRRLPRHPRAPLRSPHQGGGPSVPIHHGQYRELAAQLSLYGC